MGGRATFENVDENVREIHEPRVRRESGAWRDCVQKDWQCLHSYHSVATDITHI